MSACPEQEIVFLGSGSKGNATLVRAGGTSVLLDCGFSGRELQRRLALAGTEPAALDAVFVTHEHSDHVTALPLLARLEGLPVYMSRKTQQAARFGPRARCQRIAIAPGHTVQVRALEVSAYATSHDAQEPIGFVVTLPGGIRLGLATDLGVATPAVELALAGCELLGLECNHDQDMLISGPYPWFLKRRIQSERGHLCNDAAAALLDRVASRRLQHVFALHISENNNRPELARAALERTLRARGSDAAVTTVAQDRATRLALPTRHAPGAAVTAEQMGLL